MKDHSGETTWTYKAPTKETASARVNQRGGDYDRLTIDGFDTYRQRDGQNKIRFLPATWDNPKHFGYDVYVHYGVGADEQQYICPLKMRLGPCPVCEALANASEGDAEELKKKLYATKRVAYFLLDRKSETPEQILVWFAPWKMVDKKMAAQMTTEEGETLEVDNPEGGYDYMYTKTGQQLGTEYSAEKFSRNVSPISDDPDVLKKIMRRIIKHPLPSVLDVKPYEYIANVFNGTVAEKPKADEDDGPTTLADEKPKRRVEVDDDEDAPPPPKRTKPAAASVEDDADTPTPAPKKPAKALPSLDTDDEDAPTPPPAKRKANIPPSPSEDDDEDAPPPPKSSKMRDAARKAMVEDDDE